MTAPFAPLIIKDYKNYSDSVVRRSYGILCSAVGIFLNLISFAMKIIAGIISGSVAMQADAFNNLSDAASSIISLLGFKLSGKKPDATHPYGHGRMEYIASFIISSLILVVGLQFLKSSIEKIIHPTEVVFYPIYD